MTMHEPVPSDPSVEKPAVEELPAPSPLADNVVFTPRQTAGTRRKLAPIIGAVVVVLIAAVVWIRASSDGPFQLLGADAPENAEAALLAAERDVQALAERAGASGEVVCYYVTSRASTGPAATLLGVACGPLSFPEVGVLWLGSMATISSSAMSPPQVVVEPGWSEAIPPDLEIEKLSRPDGRDPR